LGSKIDPNWVKYEVNYDPKVLHCAVYAMWARPAEGVHPNSGPKYHDLDPLKVVKSSGFIHLKSGHFGGHPEIGEFHDMSKIVHFLHIPTKRVFSCFEGPKMVQNWTNLEVRNGPI
jgi:hypothetical protein